MAETARESQKGEGKQRSLKNLRPFKRGCPIPKSPGRPRKMAWVEELERIASQPAEKKKLMLALLRKKPDVAMQYLAGKPVDTVLLTANVQASVSIDPTTLEAAKKIAEAL